MTFSNRFSHLAVVFMTFFFLQGYAQPDGSAYHAISRLDYYTDEKTGEIAVYIPESKAKMEITIDLVFEFQFLNRGFPVVPRGVSSVPFSMELLREGNNEVTVSFYENEKWIDSRKVNVEIKPASINAVKRDRASGCYSVGGNRVFPVGLNCEWPVSSIKLEEYASNGLNMISPDWQAGKKGRKERVRFMDRCAALGIMINYDLSALVDISRSDREQEKNRKALTKEVNYFRDHPALLSWKVPGGKDNERMLAVYYSLIKETDPYHPLSMDPPSPFDPESIDMSALSPEKARMLTYWGIIHHASGILNYFDDHQPVTPALSFIREEHLSVANEIVALQLSLCSGQAAPVVTHGHEGLYTLDLNYHGLFIILAVNTTDNPMDVTLTMPEFTDLTTKAEVMSEDRQVKVNNGIITDHMIPLGVNIYQIDLR
ncbi:MAG: hypothetical protein R6W71_04015 [Bacteroidales bacterium]